MRDPYNLQTVVDSSVDSFKRIELKDLPEYHMEDWDLFDEKEFKKYVATIEKCVRNSTEYKSLIQFMREYMNMSECSYYEHISNSANVKIRIELHHEPIDLYTMVIIVYNKHVQCGESIDEEEIAKEVMWLHYTLMVGLIPLSETVHELVHNNYLFIPNDRVLGNWKEFVARYTPYMYPEHLDILDKIEQATRSYNHDVTLLTKKPVYVDYTGSYDLPTTEDIIQSMRNRIDEIKSTSTIINTHTNN